jgi:hypothetical protein
LLTSRYAFRFKQFTEPYLLANGTPILDTKRCLRLALTDLLSTDSEVVAVAVAWLSVNVTHIDSLEEP